MIEQIRNYEYRMIFWMHTQKQTQENKSSHHKITSHHIDILKA